MFFRLKRHLLVVLAAVAAGFGVSSGAVAQESSQIVLTDVLTNDNPNRTERFGRTNITGKVVNPKGFKITISVGGDDAINVGDSTDEVRSEVVNEGPLSAGGGYGIGAGKGARVINRGPIESGGNGIRVGNSTKTYQSLVENYAPITIKDTGTGIYMGEGGKVINRAPIMTEGGSADGIRINDSTDKYQSVIENYASITTKGDSAVGIEADDGARVINRGPIETAGSSAHGIWAGASTDKYQSVVENYAAITTKGTDADGIKVGTTDVDGNEIAGAKVINWGNITTEGDGPYGISVGDSTRKYRSVIENHATITSKHLSGKGVTVGFGGRVVNYGTIDTQSDGVVMNGNLDPDPATGFAGYRSTLENYGSIISRDTVAVGAQGANGVRVINWGTMISETSDVARFAEGNAAYRTVVENYGLMQGDNLGMILNDQSLLINRGRIVALKQHGIQVNGSELDDTHRTVIENYGTITTLGSGAFSHGIFAWEPGVGILNRGSIITTGGAGGGSAPHGIYYNANPDPDVRAEVDGYKTEEIINEGIIHVSGQGANAIHAGDKSIVINRGSLVSLNGKAINFIAGGNRLTLGSESYIVGNINLGTGTRVALDLSGGGSGLWQGEGTLTGEITASGGRGNMAWAYNKDTGQLAIFDASVFSSGEDTLAAASSGVSDLVGGRLDRLAGVVGSTSRQTAAMDGGMLTGHDAAVGVWFSTGGGIQQFDRYATTPETTQVSWSGVLGVDYTPLDRSYTVGLFTGYVSNDTWGGAPVNAAPNQKRSFERDDSGVVAGVYGRVYRGAWFADAGLSFGYSDFDHRRWTNDATQDNGLSVLWASQDGWWVRPQLRVGHAIPLQGGWTAIPSLSVSYGRQHLSGYKEKGKSSAAIEVKSRTVSFISGGGQLALERAVGRKGTVRFHGGYDYRDSVGSQTTKVRLLGQDRSVTSSSKARHEFSAGIGGSYALGPGIRVEAWGSALFGPDHRGGHGGLDLISHF